MGENSALRPGRPVGPALRTFGNEILAAARAALDGAPGDPASSVHDFRRAMKRWRALLRLLEPHWPEAGRLRMAARDLARGLAEARDAQSALDALGDLAGPRGAPPRISSRSLATIRSRLQARRHGHDTTALDPAARRRLRRHLDEAAAAFGSAPLDALDFDALAEGLTRTYRRARRARTGGRPATGAHMLHALRRRVVEHRHQMPIVELLWPRLGRLWVAEAQRLRNRLGAHQDLAVLRNLCAPREPLAPWRARLLPLIEARQAAHAAAARRMAGRLFAERPKDFRRRLQALWRSRAPAPGPRRKTPPRRSAAALRDRKASEEE